jgi:predicted DNA-binding transcriptional regulator AlpA
MVGVVIAVANHCEATMQNLLDEKTLEAGVYSFRDLQSLGFVKDRTDLHRKQRKYAFPLPIKLGERQAGFLRAEVHGWLRDRAGACRPKEELPENNQPTTIT